MRKRSSVIVLSLGGALCAALLAAWWLRARAPAVSPRAPDIPGLGDLARQNRARIERLRAELQHAPAADREAKAGAAARYPAALVGEIKTELAVLSTARTMFNRDELIRTEMERLARDANHVALAIDLATDWRLATELFGSEQAQSRVYALQLLRHLADSGKTDSVATAVDRIGAQLNTETSWTKGIEYDYVDALASYLRAVGLDNFLGDQAAYYDRMHLTERTSVEVQKAVHDSGILNNAPDSVLAQVRREFWSYLGKEPPHG